MPGQVDAGPLRETSSDVRTAVTTQRRINLPDGGA